MAASTVGLQKIMIFKLLLACMVVVLCCALSLSLLEVYFSLLEVYYYVGMLGEHQLCVGFRYLLR